jgi:hypothetical protein
VIAAKLDESVTSAKLMENPLDEYVTMAYLTNIMGGFNENTSTLGIPQELERKVIERCQPYLINKTEHKSKQWWIRTKLAEQYQCDMLALCEREDRRFDDLQQDGMRICPCLPTGLGNNLLFLLINKLII